MTAPYYEADGVTLYHADANEISDWQAADVLVTDPPYGVLWQTGRLSGTRSARRASAGTQDVAGDHDTQARDDVLAKWGIGWAGVTKPAVVFGSWRYPPPATPRLWLIWHKAGRYPAVSPSPFYANHEDIWLFGDGWQGKPTPSVFTTTEARAMQPNKIGHPTPKPQPLMEMLVSKCPDGVIADPFAGSGTTLVAARAQGRQAIGVEIEEEYCELIASRLAQGVLFV